MMRRDVGKAGNPPALGAGDRRFESGHPDWNRQEGEEERCIGSNERPRLPTKIRGRGVKAAHRPFKPGGGGSNPSGPIEGKSRRRGNPRPLAQRESTRLITGRRRFDSSRAEWGRRRPHDGTIARAAEHLALNQAGEGSSPSGPTVRFDWLSGHRSSSGEDTAPVMRRPGLESRPVLCSIFVQPSCP
jgi:hypothetical protein